jgi:ubiquinone/menaquinone biosynthesis C-methylase UbiE
MHPQLNTGTKTMQRTGFDRIASVYDLALWPFERLFISRWRSRLRSLITGPQALEAGVGTGLNLPFYPPGVRTTAVDISPRMLERAARRAKSLRAAVEILEADVEELPFDDRSFSTRCSPLSSSARSGIRSADSASC